ncbi:MAG: hypothetical protein KME22_22035 [Hassallia sp. WJT32-NPBG1]|nr:hypothetical protein [Hassallia sp. WJT32-NPBG1]
MQIICLFFSEWEAIGVDGFTQRDRYHLMNASTILKSVSPDLILYELPTLQDINAPLFSKVF